MFSEFFAKFALFRSISSFFVLIFMDFCRNFTNFLQKLSKSPDISKMLGIIKGNLPNYQLFRRIIIEVEGSVRKLGGHLISLNYGFPQYEETGSGPPWPEATNFAAPFS